MSLDEGAKLLAGGMELVAELGYSSNSRTKGVVARQLGWNPTRGLDAWKKGFTEEVQEATH